MKTKTLAVFATLITLAVSGCGLQDGDTDGGGDTTPPTDGGTTPPTDGGTEEYAAAPVESPESCVLTFARHPYISGSECGDVVGSLPGMGWGVDASGNPVTAGAVNVRDADGDGRLELQLSAVPAGTYELTYRDRECPGQTTHINWADYGDPGTVIEMSEEARSFLQCNWWSDGAIHGDIPSPGCKIRITVGAGCAITGAGNMGDYE